MVDGKLAEPEECKKTASEWLDSGNPKTQHHSGLKYMSQNISFLF